MATLFSVLAWRIPGTGEPGGLPSMGSHRVGHDRSDLAAAAAAVHSCYALQYSWASLVTQLVKNLPAMQETWVRSPGLGRSPGEGKGYLLQYSGLENSMDCKESDMTEQLSLSR